MISARDIRDRAAEWGLREEVVEKDYVLGWLLFGIGSELVLRDSWIFKGGTCLKKCYLETFRFSEDLDFTVLPESPSSEEEILAALGAVLRRVTNESGIDFSVDAPRLRTRPNGSLEGRVYYRGPRQAPGTASVRLDLTVDEVVARPPVVRPITHLYPDALPSPGTIRCYSLEEVFAEKLRAMGERGRPRDLYDVVLLFRHPGLGREPGLVLETLVRKCESKGVPVPSLQSLQDAPHRTELESEWTNMLGHQLQILAPLGHYWNQLPELFEWLASKGPATELGVASIADNEIVWEPSPTTWVWGAGPRLEPIRFAGTNRLCVDLGYRGSVRRIEPYSFRVSQAGNLLLYAVRVDNRQLRSYRVDQIQSITVSAQPFAARFRVEFTSAGAINAPPVSRSTTGSFRSSSSASYRVQCPSCGKIFRRSRPGTRLNAHKTPDGYRCSGRSGYSV